MLPLKECVATRLSTSLILEFVRKYDLSLNQILAFLGYGYKVRSRAICSDLFSLGMRLRVILVWLSHPSSPIGVMTKGNPFKWKRRPLIYDQWTEDLQIKYSEQDFSWADPRFNKWETDQNKEIYRLKNDPPHPYVDWLLQKSWLTPFKEVRDQDIWVIRDQVFALLNERWETVDAMAANYRDSISKRLARLDKERPYSDFLEIYKLWQTLSKGVWANYYRSIGKTDPSVKQGPERRRPLVKSIEKKVTSTDLIKLIFFWFKIKILNNKTFE